MKNTALSEYLVTNIALSEYLVTNIALSEYLVTNIALSEYLVTNIALSEYLVTNIALGFTLCYIYSKFHKSRFFTFFMILFHKCLSQVSMIVF